MARAIAIAGVTSRRKAELLIADGAVTVNGIAVTAVATEVDPANDRIAVNGVELQPEAHVYLLLNKPAGTISSVTDPRGRKTVLDLVASSVPERVFPIGRLDYDTEGLLLLTNDGDFANLMMHPKHEIEKTYHATVRGRPTRDAMKQIAAGILIDGTVTAPAKAHLLEASDRLSLVEIIIHEGRNRQVRRMLEAVGYPVVRLRRIQYGFLTLDGVASGAFRRLTREEVSRLTLLARNGPAKTLNGSKRKA
ncbi:MAG: pseudouridine synthase [Solirubrobacterales bacterium]